MLSLRGNRLFDDEGNHIKTISCPKDVKLGGLEKIADGTLQCKRCHKSIVDTDYLTEEKIISLLKNDPEACIKINILNPLFNITQGG